MSFPNYFKKFPILNYLTSINAAGIGEYTKIVNIFNKINLREDVFRYAIFYYTYRIKNSETPEDIAREVYGDSGLYWLIILTNNIINRYEQWPMSNEVFESYIIGKYGGWESAEGTSHYETISTYNAAGDLVLPGGISVAANFIFYYHPDPNNKVIGPDGDWVRLSSLPRPVSYVDYESRLNDKKRDILLLDKKYITEYIRILEKRFGDLPDETTSDLIL